MAYHNIETPDDAIFEHPELRNLAVDMDEEELGEIGAQCLEDFKVDLESRSEWEEMHADWLKLYFQRDAPVNAPWEGSSDESIPMLAEACNQFHARAFPAMFPGRDVVNAIPVGKWDQESQDRAERVGKHMSWQISVKDRGYKRNKDRMLLSLPLHGSFFTKSYYDPVKNKNITKNVRATDLVVPYGTGPRNIEDVPRKSEIMWMTVNDTRKLKASGFFIDEAEPYEEGDKSPQDEAHDEAQGVQEPAFTEHREAKVIEQHRLLDLDDDDIAEPYIVTFDAQSAKVLRIAIRYDTDEAGGATDNKEPVEYYTHYPFLENPDGFYGLGYGHLIGQLNKAANKLLRQSVDAGTLANVGNMSGFISKSLAAKKGEVALQLGKFVTTESSIEDISKGIYQFSFPGANASLLQILELIMSRSDRLATVTEAVTGQTEKVMQPTTILALIEQALQVFSASFERVLYAWEDELAKIYRLNRKYMDPEEYYGVLDIGGQMKSESAARADYADDFQIKPIADPKMVTKQQKIMKAEAMYGALTQSPLIMTAVQMGNLVPLYNVTKHYLEALEIRNIDQYLPDPTGMGVLNGDQQQGPEGLVGEPGGQAGPGGAAGPLPPGGMGGGPGLGNPEQV